MNKYNILLVDDDPYVLEFIELILEDEEEFQLTTFIKPDESLKEILKQSFHVIFLDFYMHPIDGIDLCNMIRNSPRNRDAYIIAFTSEEDKDKQLNIFQSAPFDDFMTKLGISADMFVTKLKAIVRREYKKYDHVDRSLTLMKRNHRYFLDEQEISLTHTEFEILKILNEKKQDYYTSVDISESINKSNTNEVNNVSTIRVHVKNIRNKLSSLYNEEFILTVPRKGYIIGNLLVINLDT